MLKAFLSRQIAKMEATWNYDAGYMRHILEASPGSLLKFGMVSIMVDTRAAPAEAIAAAKIVGTLAEDCGPCTQIVVDMAAAEGARPEVIRAILFEDETAMGPDAALVWAFCRASLARDLETVEPLREEIVRRWGDKGLVAIALALTSGRIYPTVKYALGYGKTCSRVMVEGQPAPLAHLWAAE